MAKKAPVKKEEPVEVEVPQIQYLIADITNFTVENLGEVEPPVINIVARGVTRDAAMAQLPDVAEMGHTYQELKMIGAPILLKERKAVTLSRVK